MKIDTTTDSQSVIELRERLRDFKKGKLNLSKDDLSEFQSLLKNNGADASRLDNLVNNYDRVDLNGDGISFDELQTYKKTTGMAKPPPPRAEGLTKDAMQKMQEELTSRGMEIPSGMQQILENFDSVDTNKDGSVNHDEMGAYAKANGIELPKGGPRGGPGHHGRHGPKDNYDENDPSKQNLEQSLLSPDPLLTESNSGTSNTRKDVTNILDILFQNQQSPISFDSLLESSGLLKNVKA